jgi:hypothetical protein
MTDPTRAHESAERANVGPPPPPLWVKRFGLVTVVLFVVFALSHLTGRGFGHHMHSGERLGATSTGDAP